MRLAHALLSAYLLLVLQAAAGEGDAGPVQPVLLDDWGRAHAEMVADARARADRIQVVFVGDSITARWTRSPGQKAWDEHFAPLGALNLGISSDATQHVLWRLQHGVLDGLKPKAILVMIGTNNVSFGTDAESIAHGVWTIVSHLRTTHPESRVLVQAIFPRCDRPGANDLALKVNALLAKLDDGDGVRYLDFGARFLGPDGKPDPAVFTDGVHPNMPEGFRIWSEAILPTVREWIAAPPPKTAPPPPPASAPKDAGPSTAAPRNEFLMWHQRYLAIPAKAKEACRLVFFGDERMRAWDRAGKLFQDEYKAFGALNLAIWGARPENMLWQVANGELEGIKPALVVLQSQEALNGNGSAERACAGMAAMVALVREKVPTAKVLVLGAFPMGEKPDSPLRRKAADYNARLAKLADGNAVTVLDFGTAFLAADGTLAKGAVPSHQDYSEATYIRWAELQRDAIRRLIAP